MLFGNVALNKISVSKILLSANNDNLNDQWMGLADILVCQTLLSADTVIHEMARYQQINQPADLSVGH